MNELYDAVLKLKADTINVENKYVNVYSKIRSSDKKEDLYDLIKDAIIIIAPNLINSGSPVCFFFGFSSKEEKEEVFNIAIRMIKLQVFK